MVHEIIMSINFSTSDGEKRNIHVLFPVDKELFEAVGRASQCSKNLDFLTDPLKYYWDRLSPLSDAIFEALKGSELISAGSEIECVHYSQKKIAPPADLWTGEASSAYRGNTKNIDLPNYNTFWAALQGGKSK